MEEKSPIHKLIEKWKSCNVDPSIIAELKETYVHELTFMADILIENTRLTKKVQQLEQDLEMQP